MSGLGRVAQRGETAYQAAIRRQERWADALTAGLSPEAFEPAGTLLREMQRRIDASNPTAAIDTQAQTPGA